ncbi:hypothetical protein LguiA_012548 [Lonicera macranthoides]
MQKPSIRNMTFGVADTNQPVMLHLVRTGNSLHIENSFHCIVFSTTNRTQHVIQI